MRTLQANLSAFIFSDLGMEEIVNRAKSSLFFVNSSKCVEKAGQSVGEDTIFTSSMLSVAKTTYVSVVQANSALPK